MNTPTRFDESHAARTRYTPQKGIQEKKMFVGSAFCSEATCRSPFERTHSSPSAVCRQSAESQLGRIRHFR